MEYLSGYNAEDDQEIQSDTNDDHAHHDHNQNTKESSDSESDCIEYDMKKQALEAFEPDESQPDLCWICKYRTFRYRCPRCEAKTCSLGCIQLHKKTTSCTGQRDRTKFIPLGQFDKSKLNSGN